MLADTGTVQMDAEEIDGGKIMKKMKKMVAVVLAVVMMMAFNTVALAASSPSGSSHESSNTETTSPATGMDTSVIYVGMTAVVLGGVAAVAAKKNQE